MTNVKSYKDGDRLILVIENCNGETAVKVNNFIADVLGIVSSPEPKKVRDLEPPPIAKEKIPNIKQCQVITEQKPFNEPQPKENAYNISVEGNSGTLGNAISLRDTTAVIKACANAKNQPKDIKELVIDICKNYIYNDCICRNADLEDFEVIREFFKIYKPIIKKTTEIVLNSAGYENLNDFFDYSDEFIIRDAYRSILDELLERTKC